MKLNTIDGAFLMSQPLRPPNFVVDTLIAQGLHILAGSPKVGKSWLALWLAVTVKRSSFEELLKETNTANIVNETSSMVLWILNIHSVFCSNAFL